MVKPAEHMSGARVTIADVSNALGVTKSTVSRALNDYTDISETTRLRVRRMADKMGYRPLSHAQAIKTGLTKSLGLVLQLGDHDAQRPFLAEFLAGLSHGASDAGWTLTIAATDGPQATEDTFRSMIRDRKVDGFVLPRTTIDDPRVRILREANMPFVLFGRLPDPTGCAWLDVLGEDALERAVIHLAELGHERIGFINGGKQFTYYDARGQGYVDGLKRAGLEFDPELVRDGAITRDGGQKQARALLTLPNPPTAIACAVDMAALGVYQAADDLGLRVGRDVSVISYDGIPDGAHVKPALATYAVDFKACGKRLSELLIMRIKGTAAEDLRETVPATFLNRGSTSAPRLSSPALAAKVAKALSTTTVS